MKTFWKKLTAAALCAAMLTTPALAAGEDKFPAVNVYPGYADVTEGNWFYDNAKLCYEIGIMTGTPSGFEPERVLSEAECVTLAARVGSTLRGETIPPKVEGDAWWVPYNAYVFPDGGSIDFPDRAAGRWQFLIMLYDYVEGAGLLKPINSISKLPDTDLPDEAVALKYYNAGILTGVDKYGTLDTWKSLTRAEAAAMISRIVRPELRKTFVPADYSPFTAAYLTPGTVMFTDGTTAEAFLAQVNAAITKYETALGDGFNWHADAGDGRTVLESVKAEALTALNVTADMGTQTYKDFDYQVYYSRLIDLTGKPLGAGGDGEDPVTGQETQRNYTLTAAELPDGWVPTADSNNVSAGWAGIQLMENERVTKQAILRSDGTILGLDGYYIYGFESVISRGDDTRLWVRKAGTEEYLWNIYDVEQGKLLLEQVLPDDPILWDEMNKTYFPAENEPKVLWDDEGPYAVGADGNRLAFRQYSELFYLGDGMFQYWGPGFSDADCGLVDVNGTETPTAAFSGYFNGGLGANHGLIAMGHEGEDGAWVMSYYDYAGNKVSEDFHWAGPIGDDGRGFVCRDGKLWHIQF